VSIQIPQDFVPFVQRLVNSRRFLSEEDVVAEGLRMLRASETLKAEVEKGFVELDNGMGTDAATVIARLKSQVTRK